MRKEEDGLYDSQVVKKVPLSSVPPGTKILSTGHAFKVKTNEDGTVKLFKARTVVRGYQAGKDYYPTTYSPVQRRLQCASSLLSLPPWV